MRKRFSRFAMRGLCILALATTVSAGVPAAQAAGASADTLAQGFIQPPASARPHTWWHWMNGNISRAGITRDLEEMKRVGLGGAQIFDVSAGIPAGPIKTMSPEWREMIKFAVSEANRLGLELCIHNCSGWSSSGGPWITPEQAMQMVVTSERPVSGPTKFDDVLAQPETRQGYYRDIAVLAFRTPPAEQAQMADLHPQVTASKAAFAGEKLLDGNRGTQATLPAPRPNAPQYFQLAFPKPFTARALTLIPGAGRSGHQGELQVSDDGKTFRTVKSFTIPYHEGSPSLLSLSLEPVTARFYRFLFTRADAQANRMTFAEVELHAGIRLDNWSGKADYVRSDQPMPATIPTAAADLVIPRAEIRELSARMAADGRLQWDVPAGEWTILRIGYTPTGRKNAPATAEGVGLECDKLSREAAEAHWNGMMAKILADIGPLAGKTLNNVLIDSYEVGCQNWTPRFREEFQRRRGYDPLPYLPAIMGRVIESPEVSERFLWDYRRTIADLYTENYYGYMGTLAHRNGLLFSTEPYGNGPFNNLDSGGTSDIPMTEFWAGPGGSNYGSKLASSIAHTYGRKYVGAESFTAAPELGAWRNYPYSLKAKGDNVYCGGVNRIIFHRFAHQPWPDRKPGMTMGQWGIHFDWTNTWWEQGRAWLQYLTRCQYLLQEGRFHADLCYFVGEDSPAALPGSASLPTGYDYDGCNAEIIHRMVVKNGKLVLPSGMNYAALVLPEQTWMTPALLRTIRDLVQAGAIVIGPRPASSPSLQDYPACDQEVKTLADALWGDCDGKKITSHAFGKGKVCWGEPIAAILAGQHVQPDFTVTGSGQEPRVTWIHRKIGAADVYFVSNQRERTAAIDCSFRVQGKVPELWHADTGKIERAPVYRERNGRTAVSLLLDPAGSVFVVFRKPARPAAAVASVRYNGQDLFRLIPKPAGKLVIRKAIYGIFTAPQSDTVDVTRQLTGLIQNGRLSVKADNTLAGDPASDIVKQLRVEYTWNGQSRVKTVRENETLSLPDVADQAQTNGVLQIRKAVYGNLSEDPTPQAPTGTIDVTKQVAALVRNNLLSVTVGNELGGDPAPLVPKQLRLEYTLDGREYNKVVNEHVTLDIPEGGLDGSAAGRLTAGVNGGLALEASEPGTYTLTDGSGKQVKVVVPRIPAPVTINGPWLLRFPAGLGAPSSVTLNRLESWTQNADPGVRYFSGTATYVKEFTLPNSLFTGDRVLNLDMGTVKYLAQVKLNGKDLGIFWKPPFRAAVNGILRPGKNTLEVQITNLWTNRLIGDEQLPDDRQWAPSGALVQWPDWMREGKPMPQTGRIAWTTWHHYTKDSPLLESGLLGPVQVQVEVVKPIKLQ